MAEPPRDRTVTTPGTVPAAGITACQPIPEFPGRETGRLSGFERRLVQILLEESGCGPGAWLLICGAASPALLRSLIGLGLLVTCAAEEDQHVDDLQRLIPEADCVVGPAPREQFASAGPRYDAVLSVDRPGDAPGSLLGRHALLRTASRLACLQPGGVLVLAAPVRSRLSHTVDCWFRHFDLFPGSVSRRSLTPGWRRCLPGGAAWSGVVFRVPTTRTTLFEWDLPALRASARPAGTCCAAAGAESRPIDTPASSPATDGISAAA